MEELRGRWEASKRGSFGRDSVVRAINPNYRFTIDFRDKTRWEKSEVRLKICSRHRSSRGAVAAAAEAAHTAEPPEAKN